MRKLKDILVVIAFIALSSCGDKSKVKIGYLLPNLQNERFIREKELFKTKIEQLGGTPLIASAEFDDQLQIEQAKEMLRNGAKVLVVNSINMNTAAAIVREAHQYNVKVIAYDRMIRNSDLDYYISFDNVKVGESMAKYAMDIKPAGNYILLGGDKNDLNAVFVKRGFLNVLNKPVAEGKINIVFDIYVEDWTSDNAYLEMKNFLNLSDDVPDVVLSSYDGMTHGAIQALEENGLLGKVITTGQDAEFEACKRIVDGIQTMTIYKPFKLICYKAAEVAFEIASGQEIERTSITIPNGQKEVPSFLIEPIVVDKNNMRSVVVADGFHKESALYPK